MKFFIAIYADPTSPAAQTALNFSRALLAKGHEIYRLFFLNEGVHNSAASLNTAEAILLRQGWQTLIKEHKLDAVVCVNSAQKRGISTDGKSGLPLAQGFVIGGLAQLIDGTLNAERLITFG